MARRKRHVKTTNLSCAIYMAAWREREGGSEEKSCWRHHPNEISPSDTLLFTDLVECGDVEIYGDPFAVILVVNLNQFGVHFGQVELPLLEVNTASIDEHSAPFTIPPLYGCYGVVVAQFTRCAMAMCQPAFAVEKNLVHGLDTQVADHPNSLVVRFRARAHYPPPPLMSLPIRLSCVVCHWWWNLMPDWPQANKRAGGGETVKQTRINLAPHGELLA